jgi:hypothetical protein
MPEISQEVVTLLRYLLPGFAMAAVYYGLTSHPRPSQFERVVQALLFTVVVQSLVDGIGLIIARSAPGAVTIWTPEADLVAKLVVASLAGIAVSALSNSDAIHTKLRKLGITHRSAYPGEWHTVFALRRRLVILYLKDGSCIAGWPAKWPPDAQTGHLYLTHCAWLVQRAPIYGGEVEGILISTADIVHVEFIKGESA